MAPEFPVEPMALSNSCCPGSLPSPELKNPLPSPSILKTNHRKLACKTPVENARDSWSGCQEHVPDPKASASNELFGADDDFLLHSAYSSRFAVQGGANPITIKPPFRVEPISWNLTMQS